MSSAGGLLELIAIGSQDVMLSSSPQVSYWSLSYRRITRFAVESLEQSFSGGTPEFGRRCSCILSRSGDLVHKAYVQFEIPSLVAACGQQVRWVDHLACAILQEVTFEIGGSVIDRTYSQWLYIWAELTRKSEKDAAWNQMIGNIESLTSSDVNHTATPGATLYIPLQFFWNRHAGLSIPLVALSYHEVKLNFTLAPADTLYISSDGRPPASGTPSLRDMKLYVDYVYLDSAERRLMSTSSHEYLIEQLQYFSESTTTQSVRTKLSFSHPTKFIVWTVQPEVNIYNNRLFDFTDSGPNTILAYEGNNCVESAKILFNSQDRVSSRPIAYYNVLQPYYYFDRCPATGINVYSFALQPLAHQPSGSCNMSRLESVTISQQLASTNGPWRVHAFALSYNCLRVVGGMGGVAFA
jgi:hypothetical protein